MLANIKGEHTGPLLRADQLLLHIEISISLIK
jgi:hypothetical protein